MKTVYKYAMAVLFFNCLFSMSVNAGPKWDFGTDGWMQLSFLGQVHYSMPDNAADEDDFYLRRGRIILSGQVKEGVKFFMETDNDNAGKSGTSGVSTDIQDAFVEVQFGSSTHWIKTGLILLPFSFENRASAASLLGIDYNAEAIKFTNSFVWRDYGFELNGIFGDVFNYRLGVFDGYDTTSTKNSDASLRFTGHVAVNLIGKVESGWFFSQNRLGAENYLSIGAGYDTQSDASVRTTMDLDGMVTSSEILDSDAWVIDLQSGFVIGSANLTFNAAYYDWDNISYVGNNGFAETGLLIGNWMPTIKYSFSDPDGHDSTSDMTFGVHYFMDKKHNLRAGLEYRNGDSDDWILAGVQFLI